jgi:hypothetical protein
MDLNFFVISFNHMPQDMTSIIILTFAIAKPFVAVFTQAFNHASGVVDSAVNA